MVKSLEGELYHPLRSYLDRGISLCIFLQKIPVSQKKKIIYFIYLFFSSQNLFEIKGGKIFASNTPHMVRMIFHSSVMWFVSLQGVLLKKGIYESIKRSCDRKVLIPCDIEHMRIKYSQEYLLVNFFIVKLREICHHCKIVQRLRVGIGMQS